MLTLPRRGIVPRMPRLALPLPVLLLAASFGCADPNSAPAPPTLDEFLHSAWALYAAEELDGIATQTEAVKPTLDSAEFPMSGTFTDLDDDEVGLVELEWDADPAKATGFYLVDTLDCSVDELEDALTNPHQEEVYPDNYTAYNREFTSDIDAFHAADTDIAEWETTYSVAIPLYGNYSTFVHGGAFRIEVDGDASFATRTWAPNPATSDTEGLALDQDYQVEVYYPGDGGMIHLYAMWRQFQINDDTTQDNDALHNLILSGMKGYFDDTSTYCASLR